MNAAYELIRLANGVSSIRSLADGEIFHPVAGPAAEAEALYIKQLRLSERARCIDEFVVWDVGLGAGGNALTAIQSLAGLKARLRIVSFDRTLEALRFALHHARELEFPLGFESEISQLLNDHFTEFSKRMLRVRWEARVGDFPEAIASTVHQRERPSPHAIFFDAFSPARNPEMWTLPLFENLFRCLGPNCPCLLATFSRSTMARVAMLLGGFFVGVGQSIAGKEETTIAANALELIEYPLDTAWLERARVSRSAEPLREGVYRQSPLRKETWDQLRAHPQFAPC